MSRCPSMKCRFFKALDNFVAFRLRTMKCSRRLELEGSLVSCRWALSFWRIKSLSSGVIQGQSQRVRRCTFRWDRSLAVILEVHAHNPSISKTKAQKLPQIFGRWPSVFVLYSVRYNVLANFKISIFCSNCYNYGSPFKVFFFFFFFAMPNCWTTWLQTFGAQLTTCFGNFSGQHFYLSHST